MFYNLVPYLALLWRSMQTRFRNLDICSPGQIISVIADCVRAERHRQGFTQAQFAEMCHVPLRTYKRFELGKCASLQIFIQIVQFLNRIPAFDLFFVREVEMKISRSVVGKMEELERKMIARSSTEEKIQS